MLVSASRPFDLHSNYSPAGDQPQAIEQLINGLNEGQRDQVLLGVTGSGKTFTMANIVHSLQRPAIIMAHNKTLAAQLYAEMKDFFPNNAVEYFVSYYDYYQPESYIAKTDTYIEKDSAINEKIDLMRHSATLALMERRDVVIVTSVSAIYGLGSPTTYSSMAIELKIGQKINRTALLQDLTAIQYRRNDSDFLRGDIRVKGDIVDVFPAYSEDSALRIEYFGEEIEAMFEIDPLTNKKKSTIEFIKLYPNAHYATPITTIRGCVDQILEDMKTQIAQFNKYGKLTEATRLEKRTRYDMELLLEMGLCKGIENYSRYIDGRNEGEPPSTLFSYIPKDAILFVDESHVSLPQIRGMFAGDRSRKNALVDYGFRLPSALDNRPLMFTEWDAMRPQTIYVSATPSAWELNLSTNNIVEQIIRPTGLLDPICVIREADKQVDDIVAEIREITKRNARSIVITLTKKMAENLYEYLCDIGIKAMYIHSDTDTLERIQILQMVRSGKIDVIIGINLLREGIDLPECEMLAIMDADKEGFLRSESSLIQIIGRVARNSNGRVILYANKMTESMRKALAETERRRKIQHEYNLKHNITPTTITKQASKAFDKIMESEPAKKIIGISKESMENITQDELNKLIEKTKKSMLAAASNLEFEKAQELRDLLHQLYEKVITLK